VSSDGTRITVQTPAFTGAFTSVACDDNGDGQMGTKSQPSAVDVTVTSLATGCADTFAKGFSYNPDDTSCRGDLKGPPVADFDFAVNFQTVAFSDRSTGGAPDSWLWDFGDTASGFNNSSTLQNPVHNFTTAGSYLVRLTVKNKLGSSSIVKTVQAKVPPPVADFTFSTSGRTVSFTDNSANRGGPPASWLWDFGDSGASNQPNPTHTYAGSGPTSFSVKLTVTNASGTDSVTKVVTVQ
jgi:PKD repeat protein